MPSGAARPIVPPMSEADDLARRFFALWAEYLTALISDPRAAEPLRQWITAAAGSLPGAMAGDGAAARTRSTPDAAAAAGASGKRDAAVAELARRVDELAERVAAIERDRGHRRPASGGARRRHRTPRS